MKLINSRCDNVFAMAAENQDQQHFVTFFKRSIVSPWTNIY